MKHFIIATLIFLTIKNVNAIIIRHDIEDKKYKEFGEKYSASVAYVGGCAATLIEKTWLLTAAHCVQGREKQFFTATHLKNKYRIEKIIVHPEFDEKNDELFDIALIQLKDFINTGRPVKLYQADDEQNKPVAFVGRGTYGNGRDGLIRDDYMQRGATNTVSKVTEQVIGFRFDPPKRATTLEGISSRGDSGGPAFINLNSQLYVAGVSSYQEKNGFKEGTYGVMEYYTRVSKNISWLDAVIDNTTAAHIPKHAIIDAIKDNNLTQFKKLTNKQLLENYPILNEMFYQTVILDRIIFAEELITNGININKVTIDQSSLFDFALKYDRTNYFDMLLTKTSGAKSIHKRDSTILPLLVSKFNDDKQLINRVKQVLAQGANIDAKTNSGDTALIVAGWQTNNLELINLLVRHGADLNIPNNNGDTPLMDAAYLGKIEILNYLLQNGADPKLKNKRGKTALDLARNKNNHKASTILDSYGKKDNID